MAEEYSLWETFVSRTASALMHCMCYRWLLPLGQ